VLFRPGTLDHAQRATVLFLGLNIAAVLGVSTFLELWENNRFRFATEAPVLVLNALLLSRGVDSLRRRRYAAAANTA
jgi:asparagine N-glycosylation enzyme membrane subunit Stt3